MRGAALIAAVLVAAVPVARAQECAEGRERVGGYCCWPGQTFSSVTRTCTGAARCPEGLTARGAGCGSAAPALVVPEGYGVVEAPRAPTVETQSASDASWPSTHEGGVLYHPASVRGRDEGLIVTALMLFDVGWVFGWLGALLDESSRPCAGRSCNSWPFAFAPLIGGVTATTVHIDAPARSNGGGLVLGILSVILEAVGVVAIGLAFQNRTSEPGLRRLSTPGVRVSFVPGAPGAIAGLSIEGQY